MKWNAITLPCYCKAKLRVLKFAVKFIHTKRARKRMCRLYWKRNSLKISFLSSVWIHSEVTSQLCQQRSYCNIYVDSKTGTCNGFQYFIVNWILDEFLAVIYRCVTKEKFSPSQPHGKKRLKSTSFYFVLIFSTLNNVNVTFLSRCIMSWIWFLSNFIKFRSIK